MNLFIYKIIKYHLYRNSTLYIIYFSYSNIIFYSTLRSFLLCSLFLLAVRTSLKIVNPHYNAPFERDTWRFLLSRATNDVTFPLTFYLSRPDRVKRRSRTSYLQLARILRVEFAWDIRVSRFSKKETLLFIVRSIIWNYLTLRILFGRLPDGLGSNGIFFTKYAFVQPVRDSIHSREINIKDIFEIVGVLRIQIQFRRVLCDQRFR